MNSTLTGLPIHIPQLKDSEFNGVTIYIPAEEINSCFDVNWDDFFRFVGGATKGATAGSFIGGLLGTIVPVIGTAIGMTIGGAIGGITGGTVAGASGDGGKNDAINTAKRVLNECKEKLQMSVKKQLDSTVFKKIYNNKSQAFSKIDIAVKTLSDFKSQSEAAMTKLSYFENDLKRSEYGKI